MEGQHHKTLPDWVTGLLLIGVLVGVPTVLAIGPLLLAGLLLQVFAEVLTRIVMIELDVVTALTGPLGPTGDGYVAEVLLIPTFWFAVWAIWKLFSAIRG